MKELWNNRYDQKEYVYGQEPNSFFKSFLNQQKGQGKILLPAEGEGRNAVFAALQGWEVEAFDYSRQAMYKAFQLAKRKGVVINYKVLDFGTMRLWQAQFHVVGLFYAHTDSETREKVHQNVISALLPDGKIVLEAFSKKQLGKPSGGPRSEDMLYSIDELLDDFSSLTFELLEECVVDLSEGMYHQGQAHVVRMIARKKSVNE